MEALRLPVPPSPTLMRVDLLAGLEPVAGRRVVLAAMEGPRYGWRALSEPQVAADGHIRVLVTPEAAWWAQRLLEAPAAPLEWPAGCAWVDLSS